MKESEQTLITAPQVARHCGADLKTIHNWVNAGQIRSFRTPGRHLRFRPEDVVAFLEEFGYPIPPELQHFTRRVVMIIDPDEATSKSLEEKLDGRQNIKSFRCPVQALLAVGRVRPDLIVSEVELPGMDGYHFVERLTEGSETVPVIVFTKGPCDERACTEIGAAALIRKPNAEELWRKVGTFLSELQSISEYT